MKVSDAVTKTDYQQEDGTRGYYTKIPDVKTNGLGFPNYHHQLLVAMRRCIKVIDTDGYFALKAYFNSLKGGDVSVNVVCAPPVEEEVKK